MVTAKSFGLFDPPDPGEPPPFAATFANPSYRASPDERPKWTPVRLKYPIPCDECFALQFESGGSFGHRSDARYRRSFSGGPILNLCGRHRFVWAERDEKDIAG